jgi:hypothetical protein
LDRADAEGALAGAGEDDHPNRLVIGGRLKGLTQLPDGLGAEGVQAIGPVDGDRRATAVDLVQDVLVAQRSPLLDPVTSSQSYSAVRAMGLGGAPADPVSLDETQVRPMRSTLVFTPVSWILTTSWQRLQDTVSYVRTHRDLGNP